MNSSKTYKYYCGSIDQLIHSIFKFLDQLFSREVHTQKGEKRASSTPNTSEPNQPTPIAAREITTPFLTRDTCRAFISLMLKGDRDLESVVNLSQTSKYFLNQVLWCIKDYLNTTLLQDVRGGRHNIRNLCILYHQLTHIDTVDATVLRELQAEIMRPLVGPFKTDAKTRNSQCQELVSTLDEGIPTALKQLGMLHQYLIHLAQFEPCPETQRQHATTIANKLNLENPFIETPFTEMSHTMTVLSRIVSSNPDEMQRAILTQISKELWLELFNEKSLYREYLFELLMLKMGNSNNILKAYIPKIWAFLLHNKLLKEEEIGQIVLQIDKAILNNTDDNIRFNYMALFLRIIQNKLPNKQEANRIIRSLDPKQFTDSNEFYLKDLSLTICELVDAGHLEADTIEHIIKSIQIEICPNSVREYMYASLIVIAQKGHMAQELVRTVMKKVTPDCFHDADNEARHLFYLLMSTYNDCGLLTPNHGVFILDNINEVRLNDSNEQVKELARDLLVSLYKKGISPSNSKAIGRQALPNNLLDTDLYKFTEGLLVLIEEIKKGLSNKENINDVISSMLKLMHSNKPDIRAGAVQVLSVLTFDRRDLAHHFDAFLNNIIKRRLNDEDLHIRLQIYNFLRIAAKRGMINENNALKLVLKINRERFAFADPDEALLILATLNYLIKTNNFNSKMARHVIQRVNMEALQSDNHRLKSGFLTFLFNLTVHYKTLDPATGQKLLQSINAKIINESDKTLTERLFGLILIVINQSCADEESLKNILRNIDLGAIKRGENNVFTFIELMLEIDILEREEAIRIFRILKELGLYTQAVEINPHNMHMKLVYMIAGNMVMKKFIQASEVPVIPNLNLWVNLLMQQTSSSDQRESLARLLSSLKRT